MKTPIEEFREQIEAAAAAGLSYREISAKLLNDENVAISHSSICRFLKKEKINIVQPEASTSDTDIADTPSEEILDEEAEHYLNDDDDADDPDVPVPTQSDAGDPDVPGPTQSPAPATSAVDIVAAIAKPFSEQSERMLEMVKLLTDTVNQLTKQSTQDRLDQTNIIARNAKLAGEYAGIQKQIQRHMLVHFLLCFVAVIAIPIAVELGYWFGRRVELTTIKNYVLSTLWGLIGAFAVFIVLVIKRYYTGRKK